MHLYYAPNTIAVAAALGLEEAGLAYDPVLVDFKESAQTSPDYLKVNPKGRVPALEMDGKILTEVGAILEYIAVAAPNASLVPTDAWQAARMRSIMFYLASTAHVNHAHRFRGHRWADQATSHADMQAKVPETMTACAAYIEEECLTGPYLLGEAISLADLNFYPLCTWLSGDGVDMGQFKALTDWRDRMEARPSVEAIRDMGILK